MGAKQGDVKTVLYKSDNYGYGAPSYVKPKLYWRRWIILVLFSISGLMCSYCQMTFAAITNVVIDYYDLGGMNAAWKVNLTSMASMIFYIPGSIVASFCNRYGFYTTVNAGAFLNFIAGWIRFIGFKKGDERFFWVTILGQSVSAIAQPCIVNSITMMSINWFSDKERTIATTIASFANILGSGVAFGVVPLIVDGSEISMVILLGSQAVITSILAVLVSVIFRERPPTAPSAAAYALFMGGKGRINETYQNLDHDDIQNDGKAEQNDAVYDSRNAQNTSEQKEGIEGEKKEMRDLEALVNQPRYFIQDLKRILRMKNFLIILFAFSFGFAVVNSFLTILNQVVVVQGYTEDDAGYFGMLVIGAGLVGALSFGVIADITKFYRLLLWLCGLGALGAFIWFCIVIMYAKTVANFIMLCISSGLLGIFSTSLVPIALELSEEITFPCVEGLANGLLYMSGTTLSAVFLIIENLIPKSTVHTEKGDLAVGMQNALWFCLAAFGLAVLSMFLFNGKLNRLQHEKNAKKSSESS